MLEEGLMNGRGKHRAGAGIRPVRDKSDTVSDRVQHAREEASTHMFWKLFVVPEGPEKPQTFPRTGVAAPEEKVRQLTKGARRPTRSVRLNMFMVPAGMPCMGGCQ